MAKRLDSIIRNGIKGVCNEEMSHRVAVARLMLAYRVMTDMQDFVPYDTGKLNSSVRVANAGKDLVYDTDYAEYVYNMPETNNFKRDVHSLATSQWFDAANAIYHDKWLENMRKLVLSQHG